MMAMGPEEAATLKEAMTVVPSSIDTIVAVAELLDRMRSVR